MARLQDPLTALVRSALAEDLGGDPPETSADRTTALAVAPGRTARARILCRERGVLAGLDAALEVFAQVDPELSVAVQVRDGASLEPGLEVLSLEGRALSILVAERTALNFLQHLSGVASLTRRFVTVVAGTGARIMDTRKTIPGLRALQKRAVVLGGGVNHRVGLFDQVLLKENHFALAAPRTYEEVVARCVAEQDRQVVAEARTVAEARSAVRGGARVVLLDNFSPGPELEAAVAAVRKAANGRSVALEASGGIDLDTARSFALCGVDRISVGALTHSAPALDLSLLVGQEGE